MIPRIRRRPPSRDRSSTVFVAMAILLLASCPPLLRCGAFQLPRTTQQRSRPITVATFSTTTTRPSSSPLSLNLPSRVSPYSRTRHQSVSLADMRMQVTIAEEAALQLDNESAREEEYDEERKNQQGYEDDATALHRLKRYRTNKDVETAIVRLGRRGKTDEALCLYHAVWTLDRLKQQYRTKLQQQQTLEASDDDASASKLLTLHYDDDGTQLTPEFQTFVSKSKLRPTTRLMNGAIDACARCTSPSALQSTAFSIFNSAISPSFSDGTKKAGGALSPNVFTFGSLLACCARNGDVATSLALLEVLEEGDTYVDVQLNEVIYSTVISACERSEVPDVELALEVLHRGIATLSAKGGEWEEGKGGKTKKGRGIMGVVGYNAAISTMARAAQWKMAVQLLGEMILHSSNSNSSSSRTIHGEEGASSSSSLLRTNPQYASLESIRDNMDNDTSPLLKHATTVPKPDEVTFGTVLAACERGGEWEELRNVARAAEEYGAGLDGLALTSVLHACQRLGLADEALEYLELMKRLGDDDADKTETTSQSHSKGKHQRRRGARQRRPLRGPDGVAYRLAISACARSPGGHRWRDGIRLLDEMRDRTNKSIGTDCAPDVVAYTAAVAGCSEAGEYTHAMSLISQMRKEGIKPNVVTFSAVINACASASAKLAKDDDYNDDGSSVGIEDIRLPMTRALRLLEAMQSPTSSVRPNIVTYNAAIRACAEGLNLKGAFDLLQQLKEDGLEPTIVTYGSLMTACERMGDVEAASNVFRMVKEEEEKSYVIYDGDVEGDDAVERIQVNEIIYGAAISCCRKAREPERALSLLRKMISEGLSPNAATFNTVMAALSEGGRSNGGKGDANIENNLLWEKAMSVYKVMKSKHAPSGVTPNRQTYNILVRCLASNLQPGYAESILIAMRKAGYVPDVDLYTATVRSYEKCGNLLKALGLMETMREDGYDFYDIPVLDQAFKSGVQILNRVGKGLSSEEEEGYGKDWNGGGRTYLDEDDYGDEGQLVDSLKY